MGNHTSFLNQNSLFLILEHNLFRGDPIFRDVHSSRCLSLSYREEIREWGERKQFSRCVRTKQRPVFAVTGIWFSWLLSSFLFISIFPYLKTIKYNLSFYLWLNRHEKMKMKTNFLDLSLSFVVLIYQW